MELLSHRVGSHYFITKNWFALKCDDLPFLGVYFGYGEGGGGGGYNLDMSVLMSWVFSNRNIDLFPPPSFLLLRITKKMPVLEKISRIWETAKSPPKYLVASGIVALVGLLNG